jgi:hypothetical protein
MLFIVKPGGGKDKWTCEQGRFIQLLSAVQGADNKNVSVVFLESARERHSPRYRYLRLRVWVPIQAHT